MMLTRIVRAGARSNMARASQSAYPLNLVSSRALFSTEEASAEAKADDAGEKAVEPPTPEEIADGR